MSGQWIFIQPQDVLMFRDSKPFSAQQNFVARSQFPPNPQTMQGVIRTHYLESQGVNWKDYAAGRERHSIYDAVGHAGFADQRPSLGALKIMGPFVAEDHDNGVELLVHAPLDLVFDEEMQEFATLKPADVVDFQTNQPFLDWKPLIQPEGYKPLEKWLSQSQFENYLSAKEITGKLREDVFDYEDRMGLGMNHQRRSHAEGLLYRARFVRSHEHVGLLVHLNQPLLAESGFIRIGGESRSAKFNVVNGFAMPNVNHTGRFKIVLLTPAYFREGYRPENGDWSPWVGEGKLVSAVVGKPLAISGWDVAHNRPKPLRHFVPAGSVYYFEGGHVSDNPFTETPPDTADFAAMGFGCIAIGTW